MGKYIPYSYSGRADNIVYVHTAEGTYMRGRPRKYKHTPATKKAATVFGPAASIGVIVVRACFRFVSDLYKGFQNWLICIASGCVPTVREKRLNRKIKFRPFSKWSTMKKAEPLTRFGESTASSGSPNPAFWKSPFLHLTPSKIFR